MVVLNPSIGQEASAVGVCSVLNADLVFSGYRNHAHYLAKGSLKKMINEIYGNSTGSAAEVDQCTH